MKRLMALVVAMTAGVALAADVYDVDVAHSTIGFSVRHLVINNVKGVFRDFSGVVEYDAADPTSLTANGTIKVASIDTGIKARDQHLVGPDFFDTATFPEIKFETVKTVRDGNPFLIGNFTMHGVTKQIELPVTVTGPIKDPQGKMRIGLETGITLNRQDYGVSWSKKLDSGGLVVGDEVKIEINAEAVLREAAPAE